MTFLPSYKSSLAGSSTPASTRPPSYTSEHLPRYSFDGARSITSARAPAPLPMIEEAPEVQPGQRPSPKYCSRGTVICVLLFLNGLVVAAIWFMTAIKLKPWKWAYIAEHKEKCLLGVWIPAVVLATFNGLVAFTAAAVMSENRKSSPDRKSSCLVILAFFSIATGLIIGPFVGSLAVPMGVRVNYFKHVCDGMDTRIEIDADRISPYQFRPHQILRDTVTKPYKYPLASYIDGSGNSTFHLDLTSQELDYRRYYDTYNGEQDPENVDKEQYEPHGLNYSIISYNWTANTWTTQAPDGSTVGTGTFYELDDDFYAPELGIYVPNWTRHKRSNVYDAYMRVFALPAEPTQNRGQAEDFKRQNFRSNYGVVARVASFATKKNTVEMCALRRNGDEVKGGPGLAGGRMGLGDNLPVLVGLIQGMRENEWKAGRRLVKSTQVI